MYGSMAAYIVSIKLMQHHLCVSIQARLDDQLSSLLSGVVLPLLEQVEKDVGRQAAMFTEHVAMLKDEVQ